MQEMRKTWVQSLGWDDPLEQEMATHSSSSCLENPMHRGAWQATVHRVATTQTQLSTHALLLLSTWRMATAICTVVNIQYFNLMDIIRVVDYITCSQVFLPSPPLPWFTEGRAFLAFLMLALAM